MLFPDKINEVAKGLSPEFERLFDMIVEKQSHENDLLLVVANGHYSPSVPDWTGLSNKRGPYNLGPSHEGYSSSTHSSFINAYLDSSIFGLTHSQYLEEMKYDPIKRELIDKMQEKEGQTIQLEMLIYLKIWEADSFIKRFYQICRLLNGEPYDWHFKIKESSRDDSATGKRDNLIRENIRDRFRKYFPVIYDAFKKAYISQVRNSIAHSNYSINARNINLNNYIKKDPHSQLHGLQFEEWIDIIHNTIIIYNELLNFIDKASEWYGRIAEKNNNSIQIRLNRKDPEERTEYCRLEYKKSAPVYGRWWWEVEENIKIT